MATLVLTTGASSCSQGRASACGAVTREPLDSRSTQHLLPNAPDPTYLTDPPTAGPHRPGNHPTGLLTQPIGRGVQVSMLQGGAVLVHYKGLASAPRRRLEALAGG